MKVEKISGKAKLVELIKELALEVRKELQEGNAPKTTVAPEGSDAKKVGDPIEVDMNANDGLGDSEKALVYKDADGKKTKSGKDAPETKMNQSKDKGSDEAAAAAVAVKAGAEKGGNDVTTGQDKANFTSKDENPSKESSDPFVEKASDDVNSMDKVQDHGAKTFVDAGAEKGGNDVTAGQAKANFKEKAPDSKNEKPIASAIQLKESYTKNELLSLIESEAKKLARKITLENELKRIEDELNGGK